MILNIQILFNIIILLGLGGVAFLLFRVLKQKNQTNEIEDNKQAEEIRGLRDTINNLSTSFNSLSTNVTKDLTTSLTTYQQNVKNFNEKVEAMNKTQENLTRVFSNVKKFGTVAEFSLTSLLKDLLAPTQYIAKAKIKDGTKENVEFAIKLPKNVLVPVDSHFPVSIIDRIADADNRKDKKASEKARKDLASAFREKAEDIKDKYILPPKTTSFALAYAPTESLFFELSNYRDPVSKELLLQELKRKFNITILGPTTLSVFLQSLHMGFETLSVQERSMKIYEDLKDISHRFGQHFNQIALVHETLETAMKQTAEFGKSARQIRRALDNMKEPEAIDVSPKSNPNNLKVLK